MQKFNRSTIQTLVNSQAPDVDTRDYSILIGIHQPKCANWCYEVRLNILSGQVYVTQFGTLVPNGTAI